MSFPHALRTGLIVTADDFGLHEAVNEAVERAHLEGILDAASLMVTASATADAVERARRLPRLAVGLHVVLADGPALLPAARIPDLVGPDGCFSDRMVRDGFRFFFLPHVRKQLAAEIRAQFEAFAAFGLPLDHVNAHKHFHIHPTVLSQILTIGRDYGLKAVRLPAEPGMSLWMKSWLALMRRQLDHHGIFYNDRVFGITHSGAMDENAWLDILARLPPVGLTEVYGHPATRGRFPRSAVNYRHADELAALLSSRVRAAIEERGLLRGGFLAFQ